MIREYVAVYAPSRTVTHVQVEGESTDLVARERVSEAVTERTGWVPEYVQQAPVTNNPNYKIKV